MKLANKMNIKWPGLSVLVGINLWLSVAQAGDVTVRVHDHVSGQLLSGVSVCVGSGANPDQFGAVKTDSSGQAHFQDVPRTSLMLTASAKSFNSLQRDFVGQENKSIQIIRLEPGNRSGPRCDAADNSDRRRSALQVNSFSLAGGVSRTNNRTVTLSVRFSGDASEYRASESADFKDAAWQVYQPEVTFELSTGIGKKTVFFQMRRSLSVAGASLQVTSNSVSDTIRVSK